MHCNDSAQWRDLTPKHRGEIFDVVKAWASQILGCYGSGEPLENDGKMGLSPHSG